MANRYLQDFSEGAPLGRGGYGHVVEATNKIDGRTYAIKRVPMRATTQSAFAKVLREVRLFARLDHPSIVRYDSAWIEVAPGLQAIPAAISASGRKGSRVRSLSEAVDEIEAGSASFWSQDGGEMNSVAEDHAVEDDAEDVDAEDDAEDVDAEDVDTEDDEEDVDTEDALEGAEDNRVEEDAPVASGPPAAAASARARRSRGSIPSLRITLFIQMEVR